jgi:hypothetical protein
VIRGIWIIEYVEKLTTRDERLEGVWNSLWDGYDDVVTQFNESASNLTNDIAIDCAIKLFRLNSRLVDIYCVRHVHEVRCEEKRPVQSGDLGYVDKVEEEFNAYKFLATRTTWAKKRG